MNENPEKKPDDFDDEEERLRAMEEFSEKLLGLDGMTPEEKEDLLRSADEASKHEVTGEHKELKDFIRKKLREGDKRSLENLWQAILMDRSLSELGNTDVAEGTEEEQENDPEFRVE